MRIFEVVGGGTTIDKSQAFPPLGIRVEAQGPRAAGISVPLFCHRGGLLGGLAQGKRCTVGDGTNVTCWHPAVVE